MHFSITLFTLQGNRLQMCLKTCFTLVGWWQLHFIILTNWGFHWCLKQKPELLDLPRTRGFNRINFTLSAGQEKTEPISTNYHLSEIPILPFKLGSCKLAHKDPLPCKKKCFHSTSQTTSFLHPLSAWLLVADLCSQTTEAVAFWHTISLPLCVRLWYTVTLQDIMSPVIQVQWE